MTHRPSSLNRRRMLLGTTAVIGGAVAGCDSRPEPNPTETERVRRDVPLRILLFGSGQDANAIERGWGAVSEQPLSFKTIEPARGSIQEAASQLLDQATKCDVLIYPLMMVAELDVSGSMTPLSDTEVEQDQAFSGDLYAALRSGAARFAAKQIGIPLGAPMPAMIAAEELPESNATDPLDWQSYDAMVQDHWKGSAGEPSAPGWAGAMFLWRAAGNTPWLFQRDTLEPLITTEPYIQALAQMQATHARYDAKLQTPDAIWESVAAGELKGGIGCPLVRSKSTVEPLVIRNVPEVTQLTEVLLDPFSRIVSLSINCRQSIAAKDFIQWIGGGEGSAATRRQVAGMTDTRTQIGQNDTSASSGGTPSYDRWLADRLASPVTLPTLQIQDSGFYYQALDDQVGRVLQGEAEPAAALAEVARQWQAKTKEIGVDEQLRAWRRAKGMRG